MKTCWILSIHVYPRAAACAYNPRTGEEETGGSLGLTSSHSPESGKLQIQRETMRQKIRQRTTEKDA